MLTTVAAFALAGCGSGEDEKQIRATLDASARAWQQQDYERACALLTEARRRDYSDVCDPSPNEAVLTLFAKESPISDIDVDGDAAVVRREDDDDTTRMRKVDGRWLIDAG
ncbi:hypothetical protein C8N24_3532 [Solirubrobacter pauli]|uniref:DUF4878 domain-containing protein n=2 Tax=Solirubrobacter pauli TaxID=166793 RepID=A0A660LKA4_9ACTN|nr:hypothetical protein C8N24_3532 [Solirubrobacter pauli]